MRYILILLLLFILGIGTCFAQENLFYGFENTPLKDLIQQLEKDLDLSFSFADDTIKDKIVTVHVEGITLGELLAILDAQTGLHCDTIEGHSQVIIAPIPTANKVCVFLLDQDTRLPLAENQVVIDSSWVMETDRKGALQFESKGKSDYLLEVSGYGSLRLQPSATCSSIYLSPVYKELKEVVVTSYITTGIDRNRDGSITISQKPLGPIPGQTTPDILQSIQMIPGVSSLDETASGIQIHGGTSDQNLVLFDHIRVFNTGYLYGMLSRFNPYATEKATIFKTATSAVYGDRVSGVINISTDDKVAQRVSGGLGVDGLSADGYI